jgi:hypothetical protein
MPTGFQVPKHEESVVRLCHEGEVPVHPGDRPVPDNTQAAMVTHPAGDPPKPPGAKPVGQKDYPKRIEGKGKRASNSQGEEKGWDNSQPEGSKVMKKLLEDMCKNGPAKDNAQGSQTFHKDQKGKNKPAPRAANYEDSQPRGYKCQKNGHFSRDCRVNIGAADEGCVMGWYCMDHNPVDNKKSKDFGNGLPMKGLIGGPKNPHSSSPHEQ